MEQVNNLSKEDESQYKNYCNEWSFRKNSNRDRFVDWSISRCNGDPYTKEEWYDIVKDDKNHYLRHLKGYK